MMKQKKLGMLKLFALSALFNLLVFLFDYIVNYIPGLEYFAYFTIFLSELCESVFPFSAAMVSLSFLINKSGRGAIFAGAVFSLGAIFRIFPTDYLAYMSLGYSTPDALLYGASAAFLSLLLILLEAVIILFIILFFTKLFVKEKGLLSASSFSSLSAFSPFDFSVASLSVLIGAAPRFIYSIIMEIIDTVDYITRYFGTYKLGEIVYISVRYLLILLTLFLTQLLACFIKRYVNIACFTREEKDKENDNR